MLPPECSMLLDSTKLNTSKYMPRAEKREAYA